MTNRYTRCSTKWHVELEYLRWHQLSYVWDDFNNYTKINPRSTSGWAWWSSRDFFLPAFIECHSTSWSVIWPLRKFVRPSCRVVRPHVIQLNSMLWSAIRLRLVSVDLVWDKACMDLKANPEKTPNSSPGLTNRRVETRLFFHNVWVLFIKISLAIFQDIISYYLESLAIFQYHQASQRPREIRSLGETTSKRNNLQEKQFLREVTRRTTAYRDLHNDPLVRSSDPQQFDHLPTGWTLNLIHSSNGNPSLYAQESFKCFPSQPLKTTFQSSTTWLTSNSYAIDARQRHGLMPHYHSPTIKGVLSGHYPWLAQQLVSFPYKMTISL